MLALGLAGYVPVGAAGEVSVTINAPERALPGGSFAATVNISQVVELNAVQYDIVFDPSLLRLDDVTPGKVDSTAMPVQGFTLVSPGRYRVLQTLLFSKVSGSGYLAALQFSVVGSQGGGSTINLANGTLSGWVGEIPATWTGDSVSIASAGPPGGGLPTPVPAPLPLPETPAETVAPEGNISEPAGSEGSGNLSAAISTPSVREEVKPVTPPAGEALVLEGAAPPSPEATPMPSPEAASAKPVNWLVPWGIIAGVLVIGLVIFLQVRRRHYSGNYLRYYLRQYLKK